MNRITANLFALGLIAAAMPTTAIAQSTLIGSAPAAGSTIKRPSAITLNFDTPLMPGSFGAEIVMTAMPGMTDHPPMSIKAFTTQMSDGGKTLVLALKKPLVEGSYTVRWSAIDSEKKKVLGSLDFTAR